jgi:methylenetetrahydrofolate dehydrogenase (NADP+) / methenyltetrahydrofolate cyclohydrolase
MIINTKLLKEKITEQLKEKLARIEKKLVLDIVLSTQDPASSKYVQKKQELGLSLGIQVNVHKSYDDIDFELTDGVIIQLPATDTEVKKIQNIPIHLDVDLLNHDDKLIKYGIYPPTISGILQVLGSPTNLQGKDIVVIGQGQLVGKPLLESLIALEATIISCNQYTHNLSSLTKIGYAVISATGVGNLIDEKFINQSKPQIWIDAGTSENNGKIIGDINKSVGDYSNIRLCPCPGGVGPLTVVNIFHNLVDMYVLRSIILSD